MTRRMVFDVESIGLHGEGFAVGYAILDGDKLVSEAWAHCSPDEAVGTDEGREWVKQNCPWAQWAVALIPEEYGLPKSRFRRTPRDVRNWFWSKWIHEKEDHGTELWADVAWPVEARFLVACVEDLRSAHNYLTGEPLRRYQLHPSSRCWEGPYPLLDADSYIKCLAAAGVTLSATLDAGMLTGLQFPRASLPHHPLSDARVSAQKILMIDKLMRSLNGKA